MVAPLPCIAKQVGQHTQLNDREEYYKEPIPTNEQRVTATSTIIIIAICLRLFFKRFTSQQAARGRGNAKYRRKAKRLGAIFRHPGPQREGD